METVVENALIQLAYNKAPCSQRWAPPANASQKKENQISSVVGNALTQIYS